MNGPTPIISSMLKSTAARRPMRLSRVTDLSEIELPEMDEDGIIQQSCCPDCTLTRTMSFFGKPHRAAAVTAFAGLVFSVVGSLDLNAQQSTAAPPAHSEPQVTALPLPEDR